MLKEYVRGCVHSITLKYELPFHFAKYDGINATDKILNPDFFTD
jgi:hypothetical protein